MQDATAQFGIRIAAAGVPIMFCLIGMIPLAFLPYSKRVEAELSTFSEGERGQKTAFKPSDESLNPYEHPSSTSGDQPREPDAAAMDDPSFR